MNIAPTASHSEDYPPLSALNDLLFCERRCYLHRVEGVWVENAHTLTGSLAHRRVHTQIDSESAAKRTSRGLRLISHELRVQGAADLVEWNGDVPFPVEYKRGRRRQWDNDDVQLCAQAICLEEILAINVTAGAIFHVKTRRRREVYFTQALRDKTRRAAVRLHELLSQNSAPLPFLHQKCKGCSVRDVCMPGLISAPGEYNRAAASLFVVPLR